MVVPELLVYSKSALAAAVKLSQRKQLVDRQGRNWHDWVQAQSTGKKLSDPRRYSSEELAKFLASLTSQKPDPRAPGKAPVKPQKLLKRYLPWLEAKLQFEKPMKGLDTDAEQLKEDPVWRLMKRTRRHMRFHQCYAFDSYEKGWKCTGRSEGDAADGASPAVPPPGPWQLLGMDCEMCATADNSKELLQVAVVDSEGQLLMQELVLPPSPVTDWRTELTGITADDLQGVTLTRKAAAKRVCKLLTPNTVLVGHGLHNDLQALQIDHPWVIDTSLLYQFKGLASFVPSLALLSEQLLGKSLRGGPVTPGSSSTTQQQQQHDSKEDAQVALALVKQELQQDSPTPPLDIPDQKVDKADLAKLCVHRLPQTTSKGTSSSPNAVAAVVKATLAAACRAQGARAAAEAVEQAAVEQPGNHSKQLLFLAFKNAAVANDVFAALPGGVFSDSLGRHSKRQQLRDSSHKVVVRKMACHNGLALGRDMAVDRGAKGVHGKKRKAPASGSKATAGKLKRRKKTKAPKAAAA